MISQEQYIIQGEISKKVTLNGVGLRIPIIPCSHSALACVEDRFVGHCKTNQKGCQLHMFLQGYRLLTVNISITVRTW